MSHAPALDPQAPPANPLSRLAGRIDLRLGAVIEAVAAAIVLVEIVILFAGVVARYVLHAPLVWSDELASIFFLWLSMLGAVVALRRGEHMRMTALVSKVGPQTRGLLEALAIAAALAFLVMVMHPAYEYADEESFIVTPALEISNAWRASAIPVGVGLMGVFAVLRLLRLCTMRQIAITVAATAAIILAFWLAQPVFATLGKLNLVVFFLVV
ncbi:MAG: TRAP transporter small permease, partial [Comamonas sp.]